MSKFFDFKNDKIIKPITIITLLYSVLMFLKYIGNLTGLLFKSHSPLMPNYLTKYLAFPAFFFVPFFSIIIFMCYRTLKAKTYNYKVAYTLFSLVLIFFFLHSKIYDLLQQINPYG